MTAHIELREVSKRFGSAMAISSLSLAVRTGELVSLLGPSGCGKTTTLNLIAGFLEPDEGQIVIDGTPVHGLPPYRRNLGMVFQNFALFPHMTVFENVAFGLRMRRIARHEIDERVREALALVELAGFESRYRSELSGGQSQRVALARALVVRPTALLLDEPFSSLDANLREQLRVEVREIQQRIGITTIFVTHDQAEALGLSDRIAVMSRGRIEQLGAPREIYERPASRFVADFIGASTVLRGRAVARDLVALAPGLTIRVAAGEALRAGEEVELAIRPERVRLAGGPGEGTAEARVEGLVYQGSLTEVTARLGDGQRVLVFVIEPAPMPLAPGQLVHLQLPPDAFMVLA